MDFGLGMAAAQAASSPIQTGSSSSTGARCAAKMAGMRASGKVERQDVHAAPDLSGTNLDHTGLRHGPDREFVAARIAEMEAAAAREAERFLHDASTGLADPRQRVGERPRIEDDQ